MSAPSGAAGRLKALLAGLHAQEASKAASRSAGRILPGFPPLLFLSKGFVDYGAELLFLRLRAVREGVAHMAAGIAQVIAGVF